MASGRWHPTNDRPDDRPDPAKIAWYIRTGDPTDTQAITTALRRLERCQPMGTA